MHICLSSKLHLGLLISFFVMLIWSVLNPQDWSTWYFEALPVVIGVVVLVVTYGKFQLTSTAYMVIWVTALVMLVGAHYSYAEMPLFNWLQTTFGLERNYYDRVGHFMQGVTPALILREILLRKTSLRCGPLFWLIIISSTLGLSGFYELVEWIGTEIGNLSPDTILERQGDLWDTQWDMFMAFLGAIFSLAVLVNFQDREL